jgi:NADPH-dependent curcumin reductase CurA
MRRVSRCPRVYQDSESSKTDDKRTVHIIIMFAYLIQHRVVESKNPNYAVGDLALVHAGWRDKVVINPDQKIESIGRSLVRRALDTGSHPSSLNIGVLGMPGFV